MADSVLHTRRKFLRTSILGGAVAWTLPGFIDRTFAALGNSADGALVQTTTGRDAPILVILQMSGGNDGLNTVIPFTDDAYHRARPRIGIPAKSVIRLSDHVGLNPRMPKLARFFGEGDATIVQGVGYPNPNRSHFRSMEIWQTASDAERSEQYGWLGRYFDNCCQGVEPGVGVSLGGQMPQAFSASTPVGISLRDPGRFRFAEGMEVTEESAMESNGDGGSIGALAGKSSSDLDAFHYIERVALDAKVASDRISAIVRAHSTVGAYPNSRLGKDLQLVSQLIAGGMPTRVYYVSFGGFDTHANQTGAHDQLLAQLDDALAAFATDMRAQGNFDRVLLMTFSEFGRRVAENGSGGTDHGTAAPMFLLGGNLKPGFIGKAPDLADLDQGDLKYGVDFRSVYATLLEKWLRAPSAGILGRQFPLLEFV